jgi:flagellin-like hook-associated protein FlgL
LRGETKKTQATAQDGRIYADIDELCERVSFEPPSAWLRRPVIQSLELFGFKQSDTGAFIRFAANLDELKREAVNDIRTVENEAQNIIDKATESESALAGLNSQINEAKATLTATQANTEAATNNLNEIFAKTGATAKQLEATEERLSNLHGDIKVETQKKEQLQADIVSSEAYHRPPSQA